MTETERQFDLALAECEAENRLLRARNERLESRQWVGLTDEDFRAIGFATRPGAYAAIEAKLKEKNT